MKHEMNKCKQRSRPVVHAPAESAPLPIAHSTPMSSPEKSTSLSFQCVEKAMKLPIVDSAWNKSQNVYSRVKKSNPLLSWAFGKAENTLQRALSTAVPIFQKIDGPLHFVDETLVKTLEKLETKVPVVKEEPSKVFQETKEAFTRSVESIRSSSVEKVCSLKEMSLLRVNDIVSSKYVTLAVQGIDFTSKKAEVLLNQYLPAEKGSGEVESEILVVSAEDNNVLHAAQTLGRLAHIVARRVYYKIAPQFEESKIYKYFVFVNKSFADYIVAIKNVSINVVYKSSPASTNNGNLF